MNLTSAHSIGDRAIAGVASAAAAAAMAYLIERRVVKQWSSSTDSAADEPRTIYGTPRLVTTPDGAELSVIEAGSGPTVIMGHGMAANKHYWAPIARRLVDRGHRIVAFDQRGHGESTMGSEDLSAAQLGDDLDLVIGALAPDGATLAGHSMGGMGLQAWLAGHPDRRDLAHGIVLIASLPSLDKSPLSGVVGALAGLPISRLVMRHRLHGRLFARGGVGTTPSATVLDVVRDGWARTSDEARSAAIADIPGFDFTDLLTSLTIPTTVICGEQDRITPPSESERIASIVPGAKLVLIPGGGHAVVWEEPDLIANEILTLHDQP